MKRARPILSSSGKEKICYRCHRMLPLSDYNKHNSTKDRLHTQCKDCLKLSSGNFDLSILNNLPKYPRKDSWTLDEAKIVFKAYVHARRDNVPFKDVLSKCEGVSHGFAASNALISELRNAADAGMTFTEYFKMGRPFRKNSNPIVAKK